MAPTRISPSYEPNDDAPQLDNGFTSGELVPDFGSGDMGPLLQQPSDDVPPGGGLSGTRRVRSSRSSESAPRTLCYGFPGNSGRYWCAICKDVWLYTSCVQAKAPFHIRPHACATRGFPLPIQLNFAATDIACTLPTQWLRSQARWEWSPAA